MDATGHIYCSLREDARIVRIHVETQAVETIVTTGGSPLGLEWMPDGRLLICNADLGPQTCDLETRQVAPLPCDLSFGICNNAHVLPDGTVLVSDSSLVYSLNDYEHDIIEDTATGRLIKITPTGQASVLLDRLSFANGVVCIDGGQTVLVAETGKKCIRKISINGLGIGIFADTDGHPDNLSIGSDGNIWVALPSLPSGALAFLHKMPVVMRKLTARLPQFLQPTPQLCCRVAVYDPQGTLLQTYNGDTEIFSMVTGVREKDGCVALGSIDHNCIAIFEAT
jgi:sugar lactone lactonase YvrE